MKKIMQLSMSLLMIISAVGFVTADERREFRNEIMVDKARESYQSALVSEIRTSEYQLEKTIIDIHGNRVRIEQYVLRPQPDQIQFLALNSRANRFDYGYEIFTFNQGVSDKTLDVIGEAMEGIWGTYKPEYWLKRLDIKLSNTRDSVDMNTMLGEPIELTFPEMPQDVEIPDGIEIPDKIYIPSTGEFSYKINNTEKERYEWNMNDGYYKRSYRVDNGPLQVGYEVSFNQSRWWEGNETQNSAIMPKWDWYADDNLAHWKDITNYQDGTFVTWEEFGINDKGELVTWDNLWGGTCDEEGNFVEKVNTESINMEMIITATEFEGRTIDLVIAPMNVTVNPWDYLP